MESENKGAYFRYTGYGGQNAGRQEQIAGRPIPNIGLSGPRRRSGALGVVALDAECGRGSPCGTELDGNFA